MSRIARIVTIGEPSASVTSASAPASSAYAIVTETGSVRTTVRVRSCPSPSVISRPPVNDAPIVASSTVTAGTSTEKPVPVGANASGNGYTGRSSVENARLEYQRLVGGATSAATATVPGSAMRSTGRVPRSRFGGVTAGDAISPAAVHPLSASAAAVNRMSMRRMPLTGPPSR